MEFRQVSVEADVSNLIILGTDDFPAPLAGFDFISREPMFFGQLFDPFPVQSLDQFGVGCVDGVGFGNFNNRFDLFVAV